MGVWIVDSKHWNDFTLVAGSMFRGQEDVTEEVLRLADVAYDAEAAFAEVGLAPGEVRAVLAMHKHSKRLGEVGPVEVVGADDIHKHLGARGRRLSTGEVEAVLAVAMRYFPAYIGPQSESIPAIVTEPAIDELPHEIPDNLFGEDDAENDDNALLTEAEVMETLTAEQLAAPVEQWMFPRALRRSNPGARPTVDRELLTDARPLWTVHTSLRQTSVHVRRAAHEPVTDEGRPAQAA